MIFNRNLEEWIETIKLATGKSVDKAAKIFHDCCVNEDYRTLLNYLYETNRKGYKMTRNEARYKIAAILQIKLNANDLLDSIENAGLIKFDEEKNYSASPSNVIFHKLAKLHGHASFSEADAIVNELMREGYQIVRKGD